MKNRVLVFLALLLSQFAFAQSVPIKNAQLSGTLNGTPSGGTLNLSSVTTTLGTPTATSINGLTITTTTGTITVTNGKTLSLSNSLTFTGNDGSTVAFGAGGTVAFTSNKLSVFTATTSAELAGVLSDETGSGGGFVRATSPTLTTPTLGAATATTINAVQIYDDGQLNIISDTASYTSGAVVDFGLVAVSVSDGFEATISTTITGDTSMVLRAPTGGADVTMPSTGTLASRITATATLDFANTAAGAKTDLTITLTGAATGEAVALGVPSGSVPANGSFSAWVSASNTVTVRFANNDLTTAYNPASGTFRVTIIR